MVLDKVREALEDYYKVENCFFGQDVTVADISQVVKQTNSDIRFIRVYMEDRFLGKTEFPRVAIESISLVGDIYGEAKEEDWDD